MRKEPFLITLIKWLCWSFVVGVGIANLLGPQEYEFMVKMWILCGTFFFLSFYLFFANKKLTKYAFIPAFVILGIASYQWRFSNTNADHISNFMDKGRWAETVVKGTIIEDPDVRDWITHVTIKPDTVIKNVEGKKKVRKLQGRTGSVVLFVSRTIRENNPYYNEMEYGDRIQVKGALTKPMPLTNPYGFNYAKYLVNKNIYASMYVGKPASIKFIKKEELKVFGRIKKFAYRMKDKMILGVKKTIPPPSSAFIGGVTVGARGGVPEIMKYDFQATGVAHVLALSGLHVGFLAFMLIMFFNNVFKSPLLFYKLPSRLLRREVDLTPYSQLLIPLFVVVVLFMFSVITGARPATVRASIMYSIGIIFHLWLGLGSSSSGRVTIPLSAAIMLAMNSFLIYDASFALSFTAVWSIIYLSGPLRNIFSRLIVGWGHLVFLLFIASVIPALVVAPWLFTNSSFNAFYIIIFGVLSILAYFFEKKKPLLGFEYEGWWPYISGFFCVQLAIQIGMMWPLSGVYFNRFPIAGILANFIAIPLIGIIVPLGLIGELFTFIPLVGEPLGLAIGATNKMFSDFFLLMAEFFRTYFPYPVQSAPTTKALAVYYLIVVIFAFNGAIRERLRRWFRFTRGMANWTVVGIIFVILTSGYWAEDIVKGAPKKKNELLVTFLDIGYGNCVLVQTPLGKNILIDGGSRGEKRFWSIGKWGKGKTVIIPNLSGYNISRLDKIIVTNPLPENVGGLIYLLEYFNVGEVWDTLNPEEFPHDISYTDFLKNIKDARLELQRDKKLPAGAYLNYYDFLNSGIAPAAKVNSRSFMERIFKEKSIPHYWFSEGKVLHREEINGRVLELKALNPPRERIEGTDNDLYNSSAVLKLTYGERSFLFPSNILAESEWDLTIRHANELKSDIMLMPDHGSYQASTRRFLDKVRPAIAIAQYGYLRERSFYPVELSRTIRKYKDRGIRIFRTDRTGAVEVWTDGKEIKARNPT